MPNAAFKAARSGCGCLDKKIVFDAVEDIIAGKTANKKGEVKVEKRVVSEEYMRKQLGQETRSD